MNLYVLACALRADQPVPLYLPSAAAARQRLLDRMGNLEAQEKGAPTQEAGERRWKDVYRYAFSSSLTEIVGEVQDMQKCVKEICGEFGLKGVD